MQTRILGTALGLLLLAGAASAQTAFKNIYVSDTLTGNEVFAAGLLVCDLTTGQCAYADGTTAFSALTKFASGGGGGPHASTHYADQSDEVLGENLGTTCTAGQIWKSDGDGTMSCAADAGGGGGSNLGVAPTTTQVEITNDGGTNATITEATGTAAGVMTTTMHDRLDSTLTADGVNAYDITTDSQTASFTPAVSACPVAKVTISSGTGNFTLNAPTGTAPTGYYQCAYVVDNQSGASRNIVFAGISTSGDRLVEFALPNGTESEAIVLYTENTGTTWRYDGGILDLSSLPANATPADDDLMPCQDVSDNPDTWKQCRVDAIAQVSRDPAPSLTGNLDLNENFIAVTQAASPVGWLGNLSTDFAIVYTEGTPGGQPSDNVGLLLSDDGVHSYGQVKMEDLVHTDDGGRIVYTAEDGTLFSVSPAAPGWSATDTDTGTFDLGTGDTTGPWVDVDLDVNTVSDVEIGDRIDITWTLFIQNNTDDKAGSIDIGFSVDGGAVQLGNSVGVPEYFNGYKTGSISTSASSAFAAGTNVSLFARRQSSNDSNFNPIVQGSGGTNTHEMFVSVPSGGTLPTSDRQVLGSHSDHTNDVTVTAADHGTTVVCDNATGMNINVDDGATDWDPDRRVYVLNIGAGDCTIQDGTTADITIRTATGFSAVVPQYGGATIIGKDVDEVVVTGGSAS